MRYFITGADGQLARALRHLLTSKGCDVVSKTRAELDITNLGLIRDAVRAVRPDFVINCAAFNDVDGAESQWEKAYMINGVGVKYLSFACNEINSTLVHFSTDYVFDGSKKEKYTIADMPNPISKYGSSKLLGEKMIMTHADKFFLIRTSWVFGSGKNSFVKKVMDWSQNKKQLSMVTDQCSSPSYAVDLAKASVDLMETGNYGLYHMTNDGECSRFEWAKYILDRLKWNGDLIPAVSGDFNSAARRPEYSALDNFPLKETIGYTLPSWQDATDRFLEELL
jgi:dTDP-4-dehydrorhamnose reductase